MLVPFDSNQPQNGTAGNPLGEQFIGSLTARKNDNPVIQDFGSAKQAELFLNLRQLKFDGQLVLTNSAMQAWVFYLHQGFIVYATGGEHPVRRWKRNSIIHFPQQPTETQALQNELAYACAEEANAGCWQYQLLLMWVKKQKIAPDQAARMIWSMTLEILFDITQANQVTCELKPEPAFPSRLVHIEPGQAIAETERLWIAWRSANAVSYLPNRVPTIRESADLQQQISASVHQMLSQLLAQKQTLREMAIERKQDVLSLLRSLQPYIQSGLIELRTIADLPAPAFSSPTQEKRRPLIACVDDNLWVCREMEKILKAADYQFIGLNDPLRAIGMLVTLKPDFIFLDLMMPNTNGYEICTRLRRLSCFQYTPIVILTGNDSVVDRVRAKMAGSTDFLSKVKVDTKQVLGAVDKHLTQQINLN